MLMLMYLMYVVLWIRLIRELEAVFHPQKHLDSLYQGERSGSGRGGRESRCRCISVCCAMDKVDSGIGENFSLHHDVGNGSGGGGRR